MKKNDKLIVLTGVIILIIAAVGIYYWVPEEAGVRSAKISNFFSVTGTLKDNPDAVTVSDSSPFYPLIATPLAVNYCEKGEQTILPLYVMNLENPSRSILRIQDQLDGGKKCEIIGMDETAKEASIRIARQFWEKSDAVLIITDSSLENVEKSRFFVELVKEHAPYAHVAVIGNKQDLPDALNVDKIQEILGLKTYSMVAIDPENRDKMMQIIADILEISSEASPLLKPLFERDQLMQKARNALENGDIAKTAEYFERLSDLCLELGDDALYREFYEKAKKLKSYITNE